MYFDQKGETIKINTLTTLIWEDHYLKWNNDARHMNHDHNPDFMVVPNNMIWQPDLELYNSGSNWKCLIELVCQNYIVMV